MANEKSNEPQDTPAVQNTVGNTPTGTAQTPGGPASSGTTVSQNGTTRSSGGEPLANANARQGMTAERLAVERGEVLSNVETRPMPVSGRVNSGQQEGYHYHWFGDDAMRIQYAQNLNYEF